MHRNHVNKELIKITTELLVSPPIISRALSVYMMSMKKIWLANSDNKIQSRNLLRSNRLVFKNPYLNLSREWHLRSTFSFLNHRPSKQLFNRNQPLQMWSLVIWYSMSSRKSLSLARDNMKTRKLLVVVSDLSASKCIANALLSVRFAESPANATDATMTRSTFMRDSMLNSK